MWPCIHVCAASWQYTVTAVSEVLQLETLKYRPLPSFASRIFVYLSVSTCDASLNTTGQTHTVTSVWVTMHSFAVFGCTWILLIRCRGVDDAILYTLNYIYSHLENPGNTIKLMGFFCFSGAFNTIQPHLMVQKLFGTNLSFSFVHWIFNCLTNRPQSVSLKGTGSDVVWTNRGAPQGTGLDPFLFPLCTADCRLSDSSCPSIKSANNSEVNRKIKHDDDCVHWRNK